MMRRHYLGHLKTRMLAIDNLFHGSHRRIRRSLRWITIAAAFPYLASASPLGLPAVPDATPTEIDTAALGQKLFNDKRLSADGSISCASCHAADKQFTDGRPRAAGLHGQPLTRRTPSLDNVRFQTALFWDGRVASLENQVRFPLLAPAEHGLATEKAVADVVRADDNYARAFNKLFGVSREGISLAHIATAIAAYERSLISGNSPFDRYLYGGDLNAISPAAIRGLGLFRGRAGCAACHTIGPQFSLLSDQAFHTSPVRLSDATLEQLGVLSAQVASLKQSAKNDDLNGLIASNAGVAALGRFVATLDPRDIGLFKTPSLRNVASTGPYMHDGSVATLADAIDLELYNRSDANRPLVLTEAEQSDILEFLKSLSSP